MGQTNPEQHRKFITSSYLFMFLALFTVITAVLAYWLARKVAVANDAEVWIHAQALWIMRNAVIFLILAAFAALWFIPLMFFYWDSFIWVKACTVAGVVFSAIWMILHRQLTVGFFNFIITSGFSNT